ncbi:hypothetical protein VPH35_106802 [Triticum aestivum]
MLQDDRHAALEGSTLDISRVVFMALMFSLHWTGVLASLSTLPPDRAKCPNVKDLRGGGLVPWLRQELLVQSLEVEDCVKADLQTQPLEDSHGMVFLTVSVYLRVCLHV